jgi:hypothetical protein
LRRWPTSTPGAALEIPVKHCIPLTWLLAHGEAPVRYRTLAELAPAGSAAPGDVAAARQAVAESKAAEAVVKKQLPNGTWGDSLAGLSFGKVQGRELGTVSQYRRLLQLGYPRDARPVRLAERLLYRVLSRDPDPTLLFEAEKPLRKDPLAQAWARETLREAAAGALAEGGHVEDPRLRGAGHRIATAVSGFLRSPLADDPFVRTGRANALHPDAHPPSWYSVAMLGAMPNLRRERAGFTERLGLYLAQPAPKKAFVVQVGDAQLPHGHLLLGDPIHADARGNPKDIPLALHYIELLAHLGALQHAPVATKVLARLMHDCDDDGVWRPAGIKAAPKTDERLVCHYWPLQVDDRTAEGRLVDVTFRLAIIARLLGLPVEYR